MDAWIDTYHAVRRLTRQDTFVFLTDSAVGTEEEDNLRHLVTNLGRDVPRARVVPFLTAKHSLDYCLVVRRARPPARVSGARRPRRRSDGRRAALRRARLAAAPHAAERDDGLGLGGWANPHADPERQVDYLAAPNFHAEFYLTQIVSHHQIGAASRFIEAADRRGMTLPGLFGVFFYRSANRRTLEALQSFLPVPVEGSRGSSRKGRRRGNLRADDPSADEGRRAALLHQQPAAVAGSDRAGEHPRQGQDLDPARLRAARCTESQSPPDGSSAIIHVAAAVDAHRFAGDEIAVEQSEHHLGDLISPPQRPSGVASSTARRSSSLIDAGARIGPGCNGVHQNVVGSELERQCFRQRNHARLGDVVREIASIPRTAAPGGPVAEVDDAAAALRAHVRDGRVRAEKRSPGDRR